MANYTQQHLADTLKALMHEQPLDTVTVQQLVARARVNRKTFYYHFHGIDDLLGWMYTDAFERVSPSSESNLFTWQRLMDQAMDFMRSEAFYLCAISDSRYGPAFWAQMRRLYERSTDRFVTSVIVLYEQQHQTHVELSVHERKYLRRYYSGAFSGMLEWWFREGMQEPNDVFIHELQWLSSSNIYEIMERLKT